MSCELKPCVSHRFKTYLSSRDPFGCSKESDLWIGYLGAPGGLESPWLSPFHDGLDTLASQETGDSPLAQSWVMSFNDLHGGWTLTETDAHR